jgi:hypothetical protein
MAGIVDLLQFFVLGSETACGRGIDDQKDLALAVRKSDFRAILCADGKIIN